ncbi:pyruvate carboxylase [Peptostreptococcus russellii]|uniref:Pyruvate carboxylase n=1 Tax=Peptostreptococcus russellii TaxID=215200 RepID=A0A2P7PZZ5_9FIRM|nr:pyruvate carboxylase [Peptostreptococcus russellii]PSJ31294.1 pyruvate carboxylase [Peptostreptococcus russellii]
MLKKFNKVLVANRGEIAIRIFRACAELQIRSVGIYSEEDKYGLFRTKADESYLIGEGRGPVDAYLDIDGIISLAKRKKVDAIHPGYGFLSENAEFARKCEENGITFIGPNSDIMEKLGDKINSKLVAHEADVPTIPGIEKPLKSVREAREVAEIIGYPVMVKASNGGGGRGMRIVRHAEDLEREFENARSESRKAFGEDLIFIEKYIEDPKHIEVQVLGDKYGNIVHLYERDCSVQRRHQKIIEHAPAFSLPEEIREKICSDAVKIAKYVGYSSAGTLEFLVDKHGDHYFIEMNTRVQVEHTVTEQITGVDIVQSQILIAEGYNLSDPEINLKSQDDVTVRGFSIQCRITTEDPKKNFMPDTGKIQVYRSGSGAGIRLDGGNGFTGSTISPYYDSLLVKTISYDRTFEGAIRKMVRSIKEMRVRGVKTNVGFLVNVLLDPKFIEGKCSTNFIDENPQLFDIAESKDRGTKLLKFIGDVVVNENKCQERKTFDALYEPRIREVKNVEGSRDKLLRLGKEAYIDDIRKEKKLLFTDTTMRDAHQSLLATRFRTFDLMNIAEATEHYQKDMFSLEMWGGATFDVAYRFLKESPWLRLQQLREAIPSINFQMLLRASNAVGYKNYPDNVIKEFIKESANSGIDVFRIFDSLNWVENMKQSIAIAQDTGKVVEAAMCYTGDVLDPEKSKYTIDYYVDMARELEAAGSDIIGIKDMAGLLKPYAAYELIKALKENVKAPIHLHTHDTSGNGVATLLMASQAGVDIVDAALESMASVTSQPSLNSVMEGLKFTDRDPEIDMFGYNELGKYYRDLRKVYYKFESDLKTSNAEIYDFEIPGGQYTNLKPQADSLGLVNRFEEVKENYKVANKVVGDIIKVTPSSKVVGDLAIFMTKNNLTEDNIVEEGKNLSFPDSLVDYCKGMIGQPMGGVPKELQEVVLKGEDAITARPGSLLPDEDFEAIKTHLRDDLDIKDPTNRQVLSYSLYPKVFDDYIAHVRDFNDVSKIESDVFFYGLNIGQECEVEIEEGKVLTIKLVDIGDAKEDGTRTLTFELNGMLRDVEILDNNYAGKIVNVEKADMNDPHQIGASIPGKVAKILVKEGDIVKENQPLIVIEAMKMETNIVAKSAGKVKDIKVSEGQMVIDKQLLIQLELAD